ncbi:hypothetical protein LRC484719_13870 [Mycobacterium riyadhense]
MAASAAKNLKSANIPNPRMNATLRGLACSAAWVRVDNLEIAFDVRTWRWDVLLLGMPSRAR